MKKNVILTLISLLALYCVTNISCVNNTQKVYRDLLIEWDNKQIKFPKHCTFVNISGDTVPYNIDSRSYKILTYIDTIGCTVCNLQLPMWDKFMSNISTATKKNIPFLMFVYPTSIEELRFIQKRDKFNYPICIDSKDSLNKLNHFPLNMMFQTFLLNEENRVVAIGNPLENPQIEELYIKIISGRLDSNTKCSVRTQIEIDTMTIDWGNFHWTEEQEKELILRNIGKELLTLNNVITSCGCIHVDYSQQPILPDSVTSIRLKYKADNPEHFNKTIKIYCNVDGAPIQLKLIGNAQY